MALTKAKISENLFKKLKIRKCDAKSIVDLFFQQICYSLENGEPVKLSGFGNFSLRNKTKRPGRNPKTGENIPIDARRVVTFRAGQKLKNKIKNIKIYK
ncbi:MAG: integration host factor subunit alpha [Arsenophonus sp.]|nr:MAG: integration host factor subunit alpha [Arsenophonus sp.]